MPDVGTADRAALEVALDALHVGRREAADHVPGQQSRRFLRAAHAVEVDAHGSLPPAAGACSLRIVRSLRRALNMRVFTVFTGHSMISPISSHEWSK